MAEPTSTIVMAAPLAAGLTIFGVATGLHPEILLAGLAGGLWAQSYHPPMPIWKRVAITIIAALVAGYLTPLVSAGVFVAATSTWPASHEVVTLAILQLPIAVVVGLLSHKVLGPAIVRLVGRKAEEVSK